MVAGGGETSLASEVLKEPPTVDLEIICHFIFHTKAMHQPVIT